jgi:hypothetical protein
MSVGLEDTQAPAQRLTMDGRWKSVALISICVISTCVSAQSPTCASRCLQSQCRGCLPSNDVCDKSISQTDCFAHQSQGWCWCGKFQFFRAQDSHVGENLNATGPCTAALGEQLCLDMPRCTGFALNDQPACFFRSNPPSALIKDKRPCPLPCPRADEGLYVRTDISQQEFDDTEPLLG